ncbi:hypothetical protein [Deinococcus aerophilus]|uniref:Cupin domain-containing protein n=1 Tax=Deinococcus aerophilus TaxID=522488 RepID=A0ABQ2GI90_9DEIO|nr:hypothetical protein [Deinococcus aerophilus]GGL97631.1 hypothetical protein GCM10010841_02500 [Deinococcus aerophilus]
MTTDSRPQMAPGGHHAAPQVLAATPGGRALLFTLEAGEGLPPHRHPGAQVVLAVLSGEVEVRAGEAGPQTVGAAGVVTHDGDHVISVLALRSAQLLVTLLKLV